MAKEQLTIVLTGRRPVRISKADWPVVAQAAGDNWTGGDDEARHRQASMCNELTEYAVRVRQHADGRVLVYATNEHPTSHAECYRGGVLLKKPTDADVIAAILRIGAACHIPDSVVRRCIAGMPAEELE